MTWFISRLLFLWLTLVVICAGVLFIGRRNTGSPVLRTLGFDVCEGKPCYKGIRPGMEWATAQRQLAISRASDRSGKSTIPGTTANTAGSAAVIASDVAADDVQLYS